jgi:hypothetical protein
MPAQYSQPTSTQLTSTQEEIMRAVEEFDFLSGGFWDEEEVEEQPFNEVRQPIQKQFVPLDADVRGEEGQNSKEWSKVLDDFGSRRVYQERLDDFLLFASLDYSSATLDMKLVNCFNDAKALTNPDGGPRYLVDHGF